MVAHSSSCVLLSLSSVPTGSPCQTVFFALFESVFSSRIAVPLILLSTVSSVFGVVTIAAGIGQYIGFFDLTPVLMIEIAILAAGILVAERKVRLVAAGGVLSTAAILTMYFTL